MELKLGQATTEVHQSRIDVIMDNAIREGKYPEDGLVEEGKPDITHEEYVLNVIAEFLNELSSGYLKAKRSQDAQEGKAVAELMVEDFPTVPIKPRPQKITEETIK